MAESSRPTPPLVRFWYRISPSLLPILAVLTALIITIPFMVLTGGQGDVARGLNIAGTAYSALLEGATGLVINDLLSPDDLTVATRFVSAGTDVTRSELRGLTSDISALAAADPAQARQFAQTLAQLPDSLDDEALTDLGGRIPDIVAIGPDTLESMRILIAELGQLERADVRSLAEDIASEDSLSAENRTALEAAAPSTASLSDEDALAYMRIVDSEGIVALERAAEQLALLDELGIDPTSQQATDLTAMAALRNGVADARRFATTVTRVDEAGVSDLGALALQLNIVRELYAQNMLTDDNVATAIESELPARTFANLIVLRPGNRLVIAPGNAFAGSVVNSNNVTEAVYLRLGGSALLFFPANLESMIIRAIPFVIAGLAVALGFKAGLFNIGAEGQLYIGATLAVWFGFSPIFAGLPAFIHVPLVIIAGIIGGALWGAIPGALKAFTGAHEVIVTIMLNFVAVLLVDWLIKSTDPLILLDPTASTPRTPYIGEGARLPTFDDISPLLIVIVGVLFALYGLYSQSKRREGRNFLRPIINGILVVLVGLFLNWVAVTGTLHTGLLLMIAAVWFTDWFLNKTTLGFEMRTVGTNADAARYAGMSVRRNIILAMAMSGALAGLAGISEISGKVFSMQPAFFSGLGFDAIAVALLARTNPRNMIPAGFLWGSLLAGAGLMQVRANISIDLVKIIQALIIMFIAADAIVRTIWRVPKTGERDSTSIFSKGWGG
jgi:simple sugar transport system permease protein